MPISFKKSLFWDVAQIDEAKNSRFIIERILNVGDEDDFQKLLNTTGNRR